MFNKFGIKSINFKQLHEQADALIGRTQIFKRRRRLSAAYKILKYFFLSLAVLFLALLILFSAQLLEFKRIYDRAAAGKENLEQAVIFARKDNFSQAVARAAAAENNFYLAVDELNRLKSNYLFGRLPFISGQFNEAGSLLMAAQFLSKAVYGAADFGSGLEAVLSGDKKLNFSKFTPAEKRKVLKKIFEAAPELNGIKANLDLTYITLEEVSASGLLLPLKEKISRIKQQVGEARFILAQAVPLSQLIPALAGYPAEAKFLVLLQNNDELRPTGGFLGTYGILSVKDGDISDFNTHDIYHLDMPVKDKVNVVPPEPIKKYLVDKWFMRDANWSPDWPTAARKIAWFYQAESRLNPEIPRAEKVIEFNGVIALTPKLITDFLTITGPVTIEGQSYNKDNFQDLLQYRVEKGYMLLGVSSWQRKEVIGQIARELKIKIFDLPPERWSKIINIMIDNLAAKNLLLYLTDGQLESLVEESGWDGGVKKTAGDYLLVVDANLAALKTDAVMSRGLDYKVSPAAGGLTAQLTLSYAHNGRPDWKTSAYKSYTRVYVPSGSRLISLSGYAPGQIDRGDEFNKTWFGFQLTVEPGKIKNLILKYELPASLTAAGSYSFYLQKQPGKEVGAVRVDLVLANGIKSYSPASLSIRRRGLNGLEWEGELNTDKSFEVKF